MLPTSAFRNARGAIPYPDGVPDPIEYVDLDNFDYFAMRIDSDTIYRPVEYDLAEG